MGAGEVVSSNHELWHARDAIEAHLTVVMAALAIARHLQEATGISINLNGHHLTAADPLTPEAEEILTALSIPTGH